MEDTSSSASVSWVGSLVIALAVVAIVAVLIVVLCVCLKKKRRFSAN